MHQKYGPIIRINPSELHVSDASFYDKIYASSARKRDKDPIFTGSMGIVPGGTATFWTAPHDLHRTRRNELNSYFSPTKISGIEPFLGTKVMELCKRLDRIAEKDRTVNVSNALFATYTDIITGYLFGKSWDFLSDENFNGWYHDMTMSIIGARQMRAHLPSLQKCMTLVSYANACEDSTAGEELEDQVKAILVRADKHDAPDSHQADLETGPTVFHAMRDSDQLPSSEKTVERFRSEASVLVGAAGATSARAVSVILFHLTEKPELLQRLRLELQTTFVSEGSPSLKVLRQEPFLTACIKEGLRLSLGFVARSARIARNETLQYKEWRIPPGTPVSTSSYFVHFNELVFPRPNEFVPDRWLGEDQLMLNQNFVPFGKGSRACQGLHLAWAEMYLTVAALVKRFDFSLVATTHEDVEMHHDWSFAQSKLGSKGVQARVARALGS
ncbi:MAG: hypothetical protein M1828_005938 [Chrysothrix sp. TS-e1954]|nr:MAG: hypothetical protein M1828_005938 [Chrysothrix sp. TS-e1954]